MIKKVLVFCLIVTFIICFGLVMASSGHEYATSFDPGEDAHCVISSDKMTCIWVPLRPPGKENECVPTDKVVCCKNTSWWASYCLSGGCLPCGNGVEVTSCIFHCDVNSNNGVENRKTYGPLNVKVSCSCP
jgi:hypothetical protein